jgi:hypothetical protein
MTFRTLTLAGSALIAAALLAPNAVSAQAYYGAPTSYYGQGYTYVAAPARDRDGYPRAGSGRNGYARDGYYRDRPPPPPHRAPYRERRERCDHGSAGTILGAIAGGLLGNAATGRHGNHAAGTLAGAGAGALIGNAADRDCD